MEKIKLVIKEYLNAHKLIKEMKLGWGYFLGGIIGVLLLSLFFWISSIFGNKIFEIINNLFKVEDYAFLVRWIIIFTVRILIIGIYYFFFKTILLALLAPFFSYISEKVENHIYGTKYRFTFKENLGFVFRGAKVAVKSFFKEIVLTLIVMMLSFIPIVNLLVPILIFLIQSYFISYNFVDYTLERKKYTDRECTIFMKNNMLSFTLGGAIFTVIYFIPIIGLMVAPLISIVALSVVTLKIIEENEKKLKLKEKDETKVIDKKEELEVDNS